MIKRRRQLKPQETICWECVHSLPRPDQGIGCEWFCVDKPVPGWTAIQTGTSYRVVKCKRFCTESGWKEAHP